MVPCGLKSDMKREGAGGQDILRSDLLPLKAYLHLNKVNFFTVKVSYQSYTSFFPSGKRPKRTKG